MINRWAERSRIRKKFPAGCIVTCTLPTGDSDSYLAGENGTVNGHGDFYETTMISVSFPSDVHGDVYWFRENEIKVAIPPIIPAWDFDYV